MHVIGLMSGTSADGVDAALVEWPAGPGATPFRLLAFEETPFPAALQARVHRLAAARVPGPEALAELAELDVELGRLFGAAAVRVAEKAGIAREAVDAVASHGQTVAHHPERQATLQIGDPSVIAEQSGFTTVADFRARDLAAGGEGAPLAPFFHHAAFARGDEPRLILNLGGIANVTWLPSADPEEALAFDVGPANALVDGVVQALSGGAERMDRDGARASRGRVDDGLLAELLDDEYLRRPAPKSTGRERYGLREAEALAERWRAEGREPDDLVATLVAFTTEAIARAVADHLDGAEPGRVIVGGGGAANPTMMRALAERLPGTPIERMDAHGVPSAAAEAMAFSLMGRNTLLGVVNHLPRCTGARAARVLGEIVRA